MSRTYHHGERRIRVHGIRKDPPDLRRLARALIELAQLEVEAEAEAEHKKQNRGKKADPETARRLPKSNGDAE